MTRHPGSVEFDHTQKRAERDPADPIDQKVDRQKDPGDRTTEPVEGIGMEKQEAPQIEDEMSGAPHQDEAA